jgi:dynein assembly factor 2
MPSTDYDKWAKIEKEIPEDEEEKALKRLKEQKANMSEEEVRRLHDCWEKPEFKAMFHEYAEEVSDPKHKAEQEAYLQQVEQEQRAERDAKNGFLNGRSAASFGIHEIGGGEPGSDPIGNYVPGQPGAPEGSQLLTPIEGFVLKTWKRQPGRSDFDREFGKVFINVVHHAEIEKPSAQEVTAPDGRRGQSWSMPHLVSPKIKEENDKAGHQCTVVDICFHSEVIKRCDAPNGMGDRWREMVAKTAVEMVGRLHQLDLDAEFKLLKMKYHGPEGQKGCSTMSWKPQKGFGDVTETATGTTAAPAGGSEAAARATGAKATGGSGAASSTAKPPPAKPKPSTEAARAEAAPASAATPEEVAAAAKAAAKATKEQAAAKASQFARLPNAPTQKQWREPKYSVVHRGVGDLGQTWNDTKLSSSGRPRELCIKVELPELSSAAEIDLDITERQLELSHEGVGYKLHVQLPFPVMYDQGSAKFDKAKKVLSITVPVRAEVAPMSHWTQLTPADKDAEAQVEAERAAEKAAKQAAAEAEEQRRLAEREARQTRAKLEDEERQRRIAQATAQAEKEAQRRARQLAANPPPHKPTPKYVNEWDVIEPAEALEARQASPPAAAAKEMATVATTVTAQPPAPAADAAPPSLEASAPEAVPPAPKAAPPAPKAPSPAPKAAPPAPAPPPPPAAPAAPGLPALSNELLYELD